jgi:aspartyl-tRNA(Asn)/glutamyl-tRNA(Gln) amidotransferase subunit A
MYHTLADTQAAIHTGQTTVTATVRHFIAEIDRQQHLNAFLEVFADTALAQAAALDEKAKSGAPLGKLYGLVLALKDNIAYEGHKVSASSRILAGYTSIYSATVVDRLLAEDAIIIGRCNCDEFAMGSSNENSAYGPVLNAQDNSRVPGGSSGGSTVAVQAGMCHAALGSDTGGSIRQPASFCGVLGYKPTYGLVSRYGLIAYASSFDQIGPLTHTAADCLRILEVIAGADEYDSTASLRPMASYDAATAPTHYRIATLRNTIDHPAISADVRAALQQQIDTMRAAGHIFEEVAFDYTDYLIPLYYILTTAEASSNLSRFDGVRYGYRSPRATDMESIYRLSRTEGFGREVKNRIMLGTFVLSAGYYDAYYARAQKVRRILTDYVNELFTRFDFILLPTAPSVAFRLGEKSADPIQMYLSDIFTVLANLTGIPAVSLPLASGEDDMPVGIQLMAAKHADTKLLHFSGQLMGEQSS